MNDVDPYRAPEQDTSGDGGTGAAVPAAIRGSSSA